MFRYALFLQAEGLRRFCSVTCSVLASRGIDEMLPNIEKVIVSAIIGELASRSVSLVFETCSKRMAPPPTLEEKLDSLHRLLLRVGAVVEDAEGRNITNQAMLQQLKMMIQVMFRGHFKLDTIRCQGNDSNKASADHESGHRRSLVLSIFNPAKRLRICSSGTESAGELQRILASLETIIQDTAEFIQLAREYPRLTRQPYNMYLLLDNCMFGRQMEMEHIINFLLQGTQNHGAGHLGVLPIVGPANVGKSTLVEHVCIDERVRNHFSQILSINGGDLSNKDIVTLANGTGVIKYENRAGSGGGRVLIIVEADKDINQDSWERLYSASKARLAPGSKIIVTSRSDKIIEFGTSLPLILKFMAPEAYWYFFKVRIFGSVDVAREHPKLTSIAMEMAREMSGCFMGVNIFGGMLKSSFALSTWNLALSTYRQFKRLNHFLSNAYPTDPWELSRPILLPVVNRKSPGYFVVVNSYQTSSSPGEGSSSPKVSVQDVMLGSSSPQGKFSALAWRSHIPPHKNYVFRCEQRMPRKKRIHKIMR